MLASKSQPRITHHFALTTNPKPKRGCEQLMPVNEVEENTIDDVIPDTTEDLMELV